MPTYARIQDGRVAELVTSSSNIDQMYHPALRWMNVSSVTGIAEGWSYDEVTFLKPAPQAITAHQMTIAEMQAQLATLTVQLRVLSEKA